MVANGTTTTVAGLPFFTGSGWVLGEKFNGENGWIGGVVDSETCGAATGVGGAAIGKAGTALTVGCAGSTASVEDTGVSVGSGNALEAEVIGGSGVAN